MSRKRKVLLVEVAIVLAGVAVLLAAAWIFRGPVFRTLVTYEVGVDLGPAGTKPFPPLAGEIARVRGEDLAALAGAAGDMTAEVLAFELRGKGQSAASVAETGIANCEGYAALFARILAVLVEDRGLTDRYEVRHVRGIQRFLGIDFQTNDLMPPPYRDHDFVIVVDRESDAVVLAADPNLYDYFGILEVDVAERPARKNGT